jgi:hypothetical protein
VTDTPTITPTFTDTPTSTRTPILEGTGDANCDNQTDAIDAFIVLGFSAGMLDVVACGPSADANLDGRIDSLDAALILQFVAGLVDELPQSFLA